MGRIYKPRERNIKKRSRFASRGNRTKEEYEAHMARSESKYYADKKYIETYRNIEIWMTPNWTYFTKGHGMSASDVESLRYLIDSKLDTGSAVDEILEGHRY